ncbi:MAG: DUF3530 family protein [bacterium]
MRLILVSVLSLVMSFPVFGSDLAREQRLKDEIIDAILDGDPVELDAKGHQFLGIYMESEDSGDHPKAALILHGRGFHPDWEQVIQPLRIGLPEQGWNTLTIQMPVLEKTAKYNDYVPIFPDASPRIESAIKFLREQGNKTVVLIAHSCGYHMANHWLLGNHGAVDRVNGLIGIGMGATDYKQPMAEPFVLEELDIPVLDLFGEEDFPAVIRLARDREVASRKAGKKDFNQIEVPGADHYFTEHSDELLDVVGTWLRETDFQ